MVEDLRLHRIVKLIKATPAAEKEVEKILENKDDKDAAKGDDEAEEEIPRTFSFIPMTSYAQKEAARNMNTPLAEIRARYLLEVKAAYGTHYE